MKCLNYKQPVGWDTSLPVIQELENKSNKKKHSVESDLIHKNLSIDELKSENGSSEQPIKQWNNETKTLIAKLLVWNLAMQKKNFMWGDKHFESFYYKSQAPINSQSKNT